MLNKDQNDKNTLNLINNRPNDLIKIEGIFVIICLFNGHFSRNNQND